MYDGKWQRARAAYLKEHPLCVPCGDKGRTTAANTVDHVEPHRGNPKLFWRRSNWQSTCTPCHNVKTATEPGSWTEGGRGRGRGGQIPAASRA